MIYNVSNKENSRINLWRLDSETFKIIEFDKFTPILNGSDYTIINETLVSVFDELLDNEIEIRPIKIIRKSTEEQWDNFFELIIKEHIDPEKIKIIDENERSVWQFNHHLFVSESLKSTLKEYSCGQVEFSEGFSQFG